ncbi:hypothetical protein [Bifidobacterium asteroides]|uniref:hypothetical protein n=1 Tax=Bifidobacterium asteroides TaxID=1684 RepID=UPI00068E0F9C|nr:hypothetical protein [Bifidobacterium asteroides]
MGLRARGTERLYSIQKVWFRSNHCPSHIEDSNQANSLADLQDTKDVVQKVVDLYGPLAAFELVDYSHRNGSAWKAVCEPRKNNEITEKAIRSSHAGIGHPDLRTTLAGGVRAVDERFHNALKLLKDS